jgi:hypothetical protein
MAEANGVIEKLPGVPGAEVLDYQLPLWRGLVLSRPLFRVIGLTLIIRADGWRALGGD